MSTPPNRLASFRSYSYYHVLAMCDSSQTAEALSTSSDLGVWEHATGVTQSDSQQGQPQTLGRYSPKDISVNGTTGRYIILINGSTDAQFVIDEAKWENVTGGMATPGDKSTSLAVEGSMKISEPKGVAFLDQMVKCTVALGVDSAHVYYVLKTFFVGFGDIPETYGGEVISDIPPLTLILTDATGGFSNVGGTYDLQFVGAAHGVTRLPQYSKLPVAISMSAGNSLQETLSKLEQRINELYQTHFDCVYKQIELNSGTNKTLLNSLKKVKYVIEVGDGYKDGASSQYTVTNQVQQYKNTAGCNDPAQLTFPPHTSIEAAIRTIMLASPQVTEEMANGDKITKTKHEFKIHTGLTSKPSSDGIGATDYTVIYRIEKFVTPKTISYTPGFGALQSLDQPQLEQDPNYERIKRNIIEFDYLYTGKNIDILDFDMKVNLGFAYLQTATLSNTFKSQLEYAPNRIMQPSASDANSQLVRFDQAVGSLPVFFGIQINSPTFTNTQTPGNSIQTAYTMAKHASLEVVNVNMRIMGNTQLLGTTNRASSPETIRRNKLSESQETSTELANFPDWSMFPSYAKIKIKMPRNNDDVALFGGEQDTQTDVQDYAQDFWFDGYYYVISVENVFAGGEFSQVLDMLGLPKQSAFKPDQTNGQSIDTPTEVNFNTNSLNCYNNQVITPPTRSQIPPAIPHIPPNGTTAPTTKNDSDTINSSNPSLDNVVGWTKSSNEVKQAILTAAGQYGVDPVLMARIATHESALNPLAKARTSSAAGLFQFIDSTWIGLVNQGKVYGESTPVLSRKYNPLANSYGGAAYIKDNIQLVQSNQIGDVYLAHFMGPTAKHIINADRQTSGKALVSSVLSEKSMAAVVKANPTIINYSTTVGEVRSWAARVMAKTIKGTTVGKLPSKPTPQQIENLANTQVLVQQQNKTAGNNLAAVQSTSVATNNPNVQPCGPIPQSQEINPRNRR